MKRISVFLDVNREGVHQACFFMWLEHFWIMSLRKNAWSTHASDDMSDMILGISTGCFKFPHWVRGKRVAEERDVSWKLKISPVLWTQQTLETIRVDFQTRSERYGVNGCFMYSVFLLGQSDFVNFSQSDWSFQ